MIETLRGILDLTRLSWREGKGRLVFASVLMVLQAISLPFAAASGAELTDAAIAGNAHRATIAAIAVAFFTIASLTAGHFAHIAYFELGDLNVLSLERDLMELTAGSSGLVQYERPDYADKLQVVKQELERTGWGSMQALLTSLGLAVTMAVTALLLARLSPWLLLLPVAALPPLFLGRRAEMTLARARETAADPMRRSRHLFALALDGGPAKELRVCDLSDELRSRHGVAWTEATAILWSGELRAGVMRVAGQLVFAAAYIAGTLLVVREAVAGSRSVGDVVLAITLASQVNGQVTGAVALLQQLQRTARTMADIRWIKALVTEQAPPPPDATLPERITTGIDIRDLDFSYPGTDTHVLEGVDLHLPPGSTVAIVGENGAGKTTLVKLLCRFYEPTSGGIELDGIALERHPLGAWRERIATGFQDFVRFEFLAREAVGVGDLPHIDSPAIVTAALERARGEDVLKRLDHGLETQLGRSFTDGTELSGGQWQKLALGRAMMRQTPLLLVLDEPTSALDAQAEHLLFEQYAAGARRVAADTGAITVLVSHRFSTVRMADLILVVADGRITESGSHDDLMARGGLYAELYGLQAAQYREPSEIRSA
jgi:ATP-binding cassette, subfamily B, bacterial